MHSSETTSKYFRLNFALYNTDLGPTGLSEFVFFLDVTNQNGVTIFLQLGKENNFFLYCVNFEIRIRFSEMPYSLVCSFCLQETLLFRVVLHLTHDLIRGVALCALCTMTLLSLDMSLK